MRLRHVADRDSRNIPAITVRGRKSPASAILPPPTMEPQRDYLFANNIGHLIYVKVEREWCYINGEAGLKFKTRGNNQRDLRNALIKYDFDYWESDLEICAREMATQLYLQARKRHEPILLEPIA